MYNKCIMINGIQSWLLYILYIKHTIVFVCLCVCPELIENTIRPRELKLAYRCSLS